MTSAWSTVQTVTATPDGCWLVDDTDRATALKVSPVTGTRRGIVQGITATYGLGRDPNPWTRPPGGRGVANWCWPPDTLWSGGPRCCRSSGPVRLVDRDVP